MTDIASPRAEARPVHDGAVTRWFNMRGWAQITIATPFLWL